MEATTLDYVLVYGFMGLISFIICLIVFIGMKHQLDKDDNDDNDKEYMKRVIESLGQYRISNDYEKEK